MKRTSTRTALFSFAALLASATMAQSPVDIGLHRNGGMLEVHVRPQSDYNGIFSSVVFTVKWDRTSGAALGEMSQEIPVLQYIPLMRSGPVREHGAYNYQVFAGFGTNPMTASGVNWVAGEEYVIATIPVTGKAEFELVNDTWTHEPANNADYFVSLGGTDRTGVIYKSLSTAEEDGSITILPNPNNGEFTFSFTNPTAMDITVELMNTLGQTVMSDAIRGFEGTYRREMDLTSKSNGIYYLKIKRADQTSVHKIVYR